MRPQTAKLHRFSGLYSGAVWYWLSEKFSTTSKFFVTKLTTSSDRARQAVSKSFLHIPSKVPLEFSANSQSLKMGVFVSNYYRIGAPPRPCTEPLNSSKWSWEVSALHGRGLMSQKCSLPVLELISGFAILALKIIGSKTGSEHVWDMRPRPRKAETSQDHFELFNGSVHGLGEAPIR